MAAAVARGSTRGQGQSDRRRRYRLKPRKTGFGFDVDQAKQLAAQMSDDRLLSKLKAGLKR